MAKMKDGCVKPVRGPITPAEEQAPQTGAALPMEVKKCKQESADKCTRCMTL